MLSDNEFWDRVRGLKGQTVHTFTRGNPNTIVAIDAAKVEIQDKGPVSRYSRSGLLVHYHILHRDRELIASKNGNLQGRYVIVPIIGAAVPDEVVETHHGLRLR